MFLTFFMGFLGVTDGCVAAMIPVSLDTHLHVQRWAVCKLVDSGVGCCGWGQFLAGTRTGRSSPRATLRMRAY